MAKIKGYDFFYEPDEVNTPEKIKWLIEKGRIKLPGDLINAILLKLSEEGKINSLRELEKYEKVLISGINEMKNDLIEENKLGEKENVDWKKFHRELMFLAVDEFFSAE